MKLDSEQRKKLSPEEKRALLEELLKKKASKPEPSLQTIPLQDRENSAFPLSFAQQRLWYLDQLTPGNPAYNLPMLLHLRGSLNVAALEQSLNQILARHEVLRRRFTVIDGEPVQDTVTGRTITLLQKDLSHLPLELRQAEAERLAGEEARRSFNLSKDLLLRAVLLRLNEDEYILLLLIHHIVADGWSVVLMVQELAAFYKSIVTGQPVSLPGLPVQYVDFACWQRKTFQNKALASQIGYWKQQLGTDVAPLALPLDFPRPPVQTFQSGREILRLSDQLSTTLRTLRQQEGVTLFMVLLAAFKCLLYRYTGQTDITVGTPIAGRNRSEIEKLIGIFVNNLVLRSDLSGDISFRELLRRVQKVALEAYAHQDVPFEGLLAELKPERNLSYTPLFQVLFNMLNLSGIPIELPGLIIDAPTPPEVGSLFDLTLYVNDRDKEINLVLVYNADLFTQARMVELLDQYEHLLTQIVTDPDQQISSFSLLTSKAKDSLPNPTQPLSKDWSGPVHAKLSQHAYQQPQCLAMIDKQTSWTYQDLEVRSNQLAHYLQAHQAGPSDLVAIYAHRSAALVQAILGVLKAGAAFMILDPAYPPARLLDCLSLAQPRAWLQLDAAGPLPPALEEWLASAPLKCRLQMEPVDSGLLAEYPTEPPDITIDPDQLAYLAFTSGSTGQPKAIMGTHRPLSHFFDWSAQTFAFQPGDRFAMLSGLAHDPLLRDIFSPLWIGASLHIPDPEFWYAPDQLAAWLQEHQVSVVHLTPALATTLTAETGVSLSGLRFAFFGGDVLTSQHLLDFHRLAPAAACVNFYGATETPQAIAFYPIDLTAELPPRIPVGQGIPGAQLLVLNQHQQLAGIGELGEIYIRSPYLAAGYLADEALTQQRFIPNPFTLSATDRLYKSGDLGRFLPSGHVEFLGRNDDQVKIRGFRIEPGDIEAALNQHPAVQRTVVIVREDTPGDKRLVAYIVPKTTEPGPEISELRRFVQARLPEYMVPSIFVVLEELPLTPNNKIDRKALPVPSNVRPELENTFIASRTPTEEALAHIWTEVLNLEQVGVHDNFFQLGGHSLMATQVISRVREEFQLDLPLRHFFLTPTVAQLSELIDTVLWMNQDGPAIPGAVMEEREELEL